MDIAFGDITHSKIQERYNQTKAILLKYGIDIENSLEISHAQIKEQYTQKEISKAVGMQ